MKLDHVAIANHDVTDALFALVTEYGAEVLFGGEQIGFRAMQVQCGPMRVELIEPYQTELNDFLDRFLQDNGEGPHHLTFKTDDIERELERAADLGFRPVGVNTASPFWKEAFLHPREAGGTVVQFAQSAVDDPTEIIRELGDDIPEGFGPRQWWADPPPRAERHAALREVRVAVADHQAAITLYRDFLGGAVHDDLVSWEGGVLRLTEAAGRPGIEALVWDGASGDRVVGGARFLGA